MKIYFLIASLAFAACKKSAGLTPSLTPTTFADFLKNTEWVGTLDNRGFQYRPPCCLKFNNDNSFTLYSQFVSIIGGVEIRKDSIAGTINSIDSLPDGRTRITTNVNTAYIPVITNYIYITNRNKISGISADATQPPTFDLDILSAPSASVTGTHWKGPSYASSLVSNVPYAYPDLSSIIFQPDGLNSVYSIAGQPVMLSQNAPLQHIFKQVGARVYMAGYKILPGGAAVIVNNYFGVLLPSGDKMLVHSSSTEARLPNFIYTNQPYGPNGVTPTIYKY